KTERLKLLPRVGVAYDLSEAFTLFAGYSEGIRGQPFVSFVSMPEPEISRQFEAGIKLEFAGQLSGQVAAYQIDRDQVAVASPNNPSMFNSQGQQRSRGVEVDLLWQASESISVLGGYAHTDARFVDDLAGVAKNSRLAAVPEDSGRVWVNYRFVGESALHGFNAGIGVYRRSGAYISHDNRFRTDGYYLFDGAISYEMTNFKVAVAVKNLTDETYFQPLQYFGGGISGGGRVAPAAGRTVYLSISTRF
ncbi:MAG: TonB-dependent siderophore receptor, partial [Gammaproteobacteria bacterium]